MRPEEKLEYGTLKWVKKELDAVLDQAKSALESYIDDSESDHQLAEVHEAIHQVGGTLQMVELYGASMLAQEMEDLTQALIDKSVRNRNDAYEVLLKSILQLPDYLEHIQAGNRDVPIVLLPLLNDLRTTRDASLLSERVLFFPEFDSTPVPASASGDVGAQLDAQHVARRLRHSYELGLLGWFRGTDVMASLQRLQHVMQQLQRASQTDDAKRLWWISGALIEALSLKGLESSVTVKSLLGKVDRQLRSLIDSGEQAFSQNIPEELYKNLLYYVACAEDRGEMIREVKQAYSLNQLLPKDTHLQEMRDVISGPNHELLKAVADAIREDLAEVEDRLEQFAQSKGEDMEGLTGVQGKLRTIADTLGMLGLGESREKVLSEARILEDLVSGSMEPTDTVIMNMAKAMLTVESAIDNFLASRTDTAPDSGGQSTAAAEEGVGGSQLPESEFREVLDSVLAEALLDMTAVKDAISGFIAAPELIDQMKDVPIHLSRIRGAMSVCNIDRVLPLLDAIIEYVSDRLLRDRMVPEIDELENLADAITSVEYFLESFNSHTADPQSILELGESSVRKLGFDVSAAPVADQPVVEIVPTPTPAAPIVEKPEAVERPPGDPAISVADAPESVEASPAWAPVADISPVGADREGVSLQPPVAKPADVPAAAASRHAALLPLTGDADPDIVEIFLEEAEEESQNIADNLPGWRNGDDAALVTIRRAFHTLKGSGRLVGAQMIGEFAWEFEDLLNAVLEHSTEPSDQLFDLMGKANQALPQLVSQVKNGTQPQLDVFALMDAAVALRTPGNVPPELEVPEIQSAADVEDEKPAEDVAPEVVNIIDEFDFPLDADELNVEIDLSEFMDEPELADEAGTEVPTIPESVGLPGDSDQTISDDLGDEFDDLEPSTSIFEFDHRLFQEAMAAAEEDSDFGSDEFETEDSEEEIVLSSEDLSLPAASDDEIPRKPRIEPQLFEIFSKESGQHLRTLRELTHNGELHVNADLLRALHTLNGSARTAEIYEIAHLCAPIERYAQAQQDVGGTISPEAGRLIAEAIGSIESILGAVRDVSVPMPDIGPLQRRIAAELAVERSPVEELPDDGIPTLREVAVEPSEEDLRPDMPGEQDRELVQIFLEEAADILVATDHSLQEWKGDHENEGAVSELQRQLHTLKGGARMAGFSNIGDLSHALESLIIAHVGTNSSEFGNSFFEPLHKSCDRLNSMLEQAERGEPVYPAPELIKMLDELRLSHQAGGVERPVEEPVDESRMRPTLVSSVPLVDEIDPASLPVLDDLVEDSDDGRVIDGVGMEVLEFPSDDEREGLVDEHVPVPTVPEINPVSSTLSAEIDAGSSPVSKAPASRGPAHQELVRVRSELLDSLVNYAGEVNIYHARLEQQMAQYGFSLNELDQTVVRLREQLRKMEMETEAQILFRYEQEKDQHDPEFDPLEMDRYSTMQQLSRSLAESVNDLVSIKEILVDLVRDSETLLLQQSRVSTDLQEGLMRTRMVQFSGMVPRLRRITRQTAEELGKKVDLIVNGEGNEIDRSVLDRMVAPLEHMLRNAISHGVETPEERKQSGKPEQGQVRVSVAREGTEIVIRVEDDGAGIDLEAVRAKAQRQGMISDQDTLTDNDVMQFILESGFSTAKEVTQISGRGVGMDVVNSEIKQLGGVLRIDSSYGSGTSFIVRLPFTLAINQALLVQTGEDLYAVPLASIEGIVRLTVEELAYKYSKPKAVYEYAANEYELKHLGAMLGSASPSLSDKQAMFPVLLVKSGDHRVALQVESLLGSREVVVKPVGPQISKVRGISGATILGDGRVVLILDIAGLVRMGAGVEFTYKTQEPAEEAESQRPVTIMVVDDSITIRKVTARMLERNHFAVVTAKDGVDAVSQLQESVPDLMLLDIEMPRMDGYELATHVRKDSRLKALPIIMITSRTGDKHRQRAMDIGVDRYLGKPYQETDLLHNITDVLQSK